jgi:hypothetical protein
VRAAMADPIRMRSRYTLLRGRGCEAANRGVDNVRAGQGLTAD